MYGYRMPPMPGVHRGLPSPYLTLVFSLSGPLPIEIPTGERVRSEAFAIPVGGLHTRAVLLPQETSTPGRRPADQRGIQVAVHPLAARALFGLPAGELTEQVWELDDVVGGGTDQLRECLAGSADGLGVRVGARPPGRARPPLRRRR